MAFASRLAGFGQADKQAGVNRRGVGDTGGREPRVQEGCDGAFGGVIMWRILGHSLGLVVRNLGSALRISVGPLVILAILTRGVGMLLHGGLFDGASLLLLGLISGLILSWLATAWHRYVLREEASSGVLPPLAGGETLLHMGWSFLLGLGTTILLQALLPVLDFAFSGAGDLLWSVGPIATALLLVAYLGLRFGLVLPAAAVGRPMGLMESWAATQPLARAIAGLAVVQLCGLGLTLLVAPVLLGMLLTEGFGSILWPPNLGVWAYLGAATALNWGAMMVGLSVLTTLYGHLVERRSLG